MRPINSIDDSLYNFNWIFNFIVTLFFLFEYIYIYTHGERISRLINLLEGREGRTRGGEWREKKNNSVRWRHKLA